MKRNEISRRLFLGNLSGGLGAAWLASRMPEILAAQDHAHRAAISRKPVKFEFFTAEQAAEVEAIAAQIIPSDSSPGAREAHVIYFIDRALTTFDKDKQKLYADGLKRLQRALKKFAPKAARFSEAADERQIETLKAIEKTPFFQTVRTHTIIGFLANPDYGGNFERAGWKVIGFEDNFFYQPPFGYYDRDYKEGQ
ncbi:MAG TPA: gluconate 2-dehydrogenase subunit 3 family protein [Blastocatellia bacterium]|nr:gluconate 2-dehydrogenase subunit 3 family protein [Blastocatellia bacterium]